MKNINKITFLSITIGWAVLISTSYGMDEANTIPQLDTPTQFTMFAQEKQTSAEDILEDGSETKSNRPIEGNSLPTDLYAFMNTHAHFSSLLNPINLVEIFHVNEDEQPKA
jgi:hypothetical protein